MNWYKLATFIFYLVGMLGIGIFFFFKSIKRMSVKTV